MKLNYILQYFIIKTNEKNFFRHWLILTKPLHKLPNQKIEVVALLLHTYFNFKKEISNDDLAWKLTFDYDSKLKIKNEMGISTDQIFSNLLTTLRRDKVIINNKISKSFIPNIDLKNTNMFSLIYKFEIND